MGWPNWERVWRYGRETSRQACIILLSEGLGAISQEQERVWGGGGKGGNSPNRSRRENKSLQIKPGHEHLDALVEFSETVLRWDVDVVKHELASV